MKYSWAFWLTDTEMLEATENRDNDSLPPTFLLEPPALCSILSSVCLLQASLRRKGFLAYIRFFFSFQSLKLLNELNYITQLCMLIYPSLLQSAVTEKEVRHMIQTAKNNLQNKAPCRDIP